MSRPACTDQAGLSPDLVTLAWRQKEKSNVHLALVMIIV